MNGKQHQAYDTLGVILLRTKRLDDAEKALNQALAIDNADLHAQMHMAEIQIAKVNKTKALEIIEMLTGKRNQLPVENQNQLDELRRKAQSM
jgi:Tfp pilus assembly protein PilF